MHRKILVLPVIAVIAFVLSFQMHDAHATTFMATKSGNWDDSATWGGATPPITISSGNTVTIPAGITVTVPPGVTVTNSGTISNLGAISNVGTITENCGATFTGNPVQGTRPDIVLCPPVVPEFPLAFIMPILFVIIAIGYLAMKRKMYIDRL